MKKLKNALDLLQSILGEDREALEAIDFLHEKIDGLDIEEEADTQIEGLPLPVSFKGDYALFSDGACRGNPGPGSWGMMGQDNTGKKIFHASGVDMQTTNNRMELEGAIQAVRWLMSEDESAVSKKVSLYSDSKYVVDGIEKWVAGWKKRGWKKADKKVPENVGQWQALDELVGKFKTIKFEWVKGHAGHPQNEFCDQIANEALDEAGL